MKRRNTVEDIWEAIADTRVEAANLRGRAELMRQIAALIHAKRWTQAAAAKRCGVSQPRISDLLGGRISRFSLDALVNIAAHLDRKVELRLKAA
jgi:predicted XRE-type DNA-binding protein